MNLRRETVEKSVPPGVLGCWIRGVLEQYVAGSDTRGRPEGQSYPRSQQAIHETSGLNFVQLRYSALMTPAVKFSHQPGSNNLTRQVGPDKPPPHYQ